MPGRLIPESDDIVIRREQREGTLAHILHTAQGVDELTLRTRQEAMKHVVAPAKLQRVRAWAIGEGCDFVLLNDFRGDEPV